MATRFLRSSTFRLALLYMLLFSTSVLMLLGFIYWSTVSYISAQTDETIDIEILDLTERYRNAGLSGLTQLLSERLSRRPAGASVYLLTDKDLAPLVGNLDRWPLGADIKNGWLEFTLENAGGTDTSEHQARARVFRLSGGFILLVGRDIHDLEITKRRIIATLLWGLAIMLVLGGIGSVMMGRSTLRRIEAINETSREIMSGDLSRRVPSRNTGDDFDVLADNLNNMLNQIESLMESVRRVSDNIAHDLRTPLARLRNRLEELSLDVEQSDNRRATVEQALEEADGLLNTFNALLRIARIESHDTRAGFADIDIAALVGDVVELYEPLAEEKRLRLATSLDVRPVFEGDRDLLFQALANLLDNAIKYAPPRSEISCRLEAADDGARLVLSDKGPGIPASQRDNVFQRFFRLEQSRTTPGNGLGMSLVQAVMQLHHLRLELHDNEPGLKVVIAFP
ncbi:MAG: HAMP domain-containing histidine kinase [Thiogranum sp.]|jgi:signal transduction histidine kinase|nr:HAMP domain-containing histidine kinase [Thiogranum sp.]